MTPEIIFHRELLQKDLRALGRSRGGRILGEIRRRLALNAGAAGEPLSRELFGYRKLRIGDLRALYRVSAKGVRVLALGGVLGRSPEGIRAGSRIP